MACNHEYIKLRAAEKAIRLKEQAEEAERSFRDKYGVEAKDGKAEAIRAGEHAKALARAEQQEAEHKRYAEIWSLIKDKKELQAIDWLRTRGKEYGFKDNPANAYYKVRAWAEQSGAD